MLRIDPITGDVYIGQGDRETIAFTIRDEDGAVVDVSTNAFTLTVKKTIDDDIAAAKFQLTNPVGNGIDMTDAATGVVRAKLLNVHTAALAGRHVLDLRMTEPGEDPQNVYPADGRGHVRFYVVKIVSTPGSAPTPTGAVVGFPDGIQTTVIYLEDPATGRYIKLTNDAGFPSWGSDDAGPPPY
jgi:hypothetical protein